MGWITLGVNQRAGRNKTDPRYKLSGQAKIVRRNHPRLAFSL